MSEPSPFSADGPGALERPGQVLERASEFAHGRRVPSRDETAAAQALAGRAQEVAPAVAREALSALLCGPEVQVALQWLHEVGWWAAWLPELAATVDFSQEAGRRHKDVWEHTKQVVRQTVPRPLVRWAALLHDIGKVPTRTFTADGGVHFHGHAEVGARMFDDVARRFAFERPPRRQIRFLILHHLRAAQYEPGWTDSAVRRFGRELDEHLQDLLDLSRADITSRRPGKREAALRSISELQARIAALREEDAVLPPLPSGIGDLIMARFQLAPSPRLGELKRALESKIAAGELAARQEAEYYLPHVALLLGVPLPG